MGLFLDAVQNSKAPAPAPSQGGGFLAAVQNSKAPSQGGGFLDAVRANKNEPTPQTSSKIDDYNQQQKGYDANAKQANSNGGIFKNTVSDIGNTVVNKVKDYAKESSDAVVPFGNAILHPIDTAQKVFGQFFNSPEVKAGIDKASGKGAVYGSDPIANHIVDASNLISGTAEALFSPISGVFKIASKIPGAKQVADAVSVPFNAAGAAGSYAGGAVIDHLPISQQSKDVLKKPIQDLGSLAGQVFLGGKLVEGIGELAKKGEPITPEAAQAVVDNTVKLHADNIKAAEQMDNSKLLDSAGTAQDKVLSQEQQVKNNADLNFPVKPTGETTAPDLTKEKPAVGGETAPVSTEPAPHIKSMFAEPASQDAAAPTKASNDINDVLVKQGYDKLPPELQAKYTPQKYGEIAQEAKDALEKDPQSVIDMVTKKMPMSEDMAKNPEIYYNEVEKHAGDLIKSDDPALKEQGYKLSLDLAKDSVSQTSRQGQLLGGHGFNDNPNSAVDKIKEVLNTREKTIGKDKIDSARKLAQSEGNKVVTPKEELTIDNFIKSITC
jgi:hypothetical protein